MSITLCFDFGNTRLKCAIFIDSVLNEVLVLKDDSLETIELILSQFKPTSAILSSVINHTESIETLLNNNTHFHKLNHNSLLPFTTPVGKPSTIGADRLALCAAAVTTFPSTHTLTIGLGTCITYNFTNKYHEFLGGSISPGLHMRYKAMHEQTALLPIVEAQHNFPLIGYDTNTNLQSGVILGISKEIDGIIEVYQERYANLKVLMTGGDMPFFQPHLKQSLLADTDLLYKGLFAINECNK